MIKGFEGFTLQLDKQGDIALASESYGLLPEDDQVDIINECSDVIDSLIPKRVHKTYDKRFFALMIVPLFSYEDELEGFSVAGFPIPFTLFNNIVVDNIVDVAFYIAVRDGEYILEGVNNTLEKITGLSNSEVVGKNIHDIYSGATLKKLIGKFEEAKNADNTVYWEECIIFKVGPRYFEIALTPVKDISEVCHALIGTAHDITDLKLAQNEMAENYSIIHEVLESTTDAIYIKNLEGKFELVNSAGAKILGLSKFELMEKRDFELFSEESARAFITSDRLTLEDGSQKVFEESCTINGHPYRFHSVKGVFRNHKGKIAGTFAISRDITDLKKTEDKVKHTNSMLMATLNATADGILALDKDHKVIMYNEKFLELWNFEAKFLENNSYEQILLKVMSQLANPEECWKRLEEVESNSSKRSYDIIEFKDGRVFERYTIPQFLNGEIVGRVFSYRDIGPRTHAQGRQELGPTIN